MQTQGRQLRLDPPQKGGNEILEKRRDHANADIPAHPVHIRLFGQVMRQRDQLSGMRQQPEAGFGGSGTLPDAFKQLKSQFGFKRLNALTNRGRRQPLAPCRRGDRPLLCNLQQAFQQLGIQWISYRLPRE